MAEGVVGAAGAARGFFGVRSTSADNLFLPFSGVVGLADESIVRRRDGCREDNSSNLAVVAIIVVIIQVLFYSCLRE